ncbi:hypothetical protein KVR01_008668 [Diaporthe batatas]|uniref:uncharacterized protein n=1 Tax=Diaporthe batatas TaxID=748121 RepID=UPI001D043628|nr:uncharacterized protein KVR01_008668 [Diaporthe batatas]KAG8161681.1 hypothetical protein KVR01_008668 [Diaporthe batatas]
MSFNPGFNYEPLLNSSSIRVLLINPGTAHDEIHCQFLPCDLNADHDIFPESPRPLKVKSVGQNTETGQNFFISCDIMLDDAPGSQGQRLHPFQRYKALSYVWGDASDLQTIKLEGKNFLVTRNLMAALRTIRRPRKAVRFWIDAICINQADLEEKRTQIPLMGRIYRQAKCVWGQVLPSFEETESLGELMLAIGAAGMALEKDHGAPGRDQQVLSAEATAGGPSNPGVPEEGTGSLIFSKHALEEYNLPPEASPLWQSWRGLFGSPYFRRIWIQQEVVLAKKFKWFLGNAFLDHHVLSTCMEVMRRYSREFRAAYLHPQGTAIMSLRPTVATEDSSAYVQALAEMDYDAGNAIASGFLAADRMLQERKAAEGSKTDRRLIDLLADYRDLCANCPRDMVFGLLGLAKDAERFYDLVDYSTPLEILFTCLARRLISLGHGVEVLLQASNTAHTNGLPSWVPNWTSSAVTPRVTAHEYSPINKKDFCAGGQDTESVMEVIQDAERRPQQPVLRVRGRIIDTIKDCSLAAQAEELMPWLRETYPSTRHLALRDGSLSVQSSFAFQGLRFAIQRLPRGQDPGQGARWFLEACCQARRDFWQDQSLHSLRLGFLQFVSMYLDDDFFLEKVRGSFTPLDEMMPVKDFMNDVLVPLGRQRRFCTTERGLFGLVPFECKPGDKIFALLGGAVPLVLRPVAPGPAAADKGGRYQLIGDAYIQGVMYGEGPFFDEVHESDVLLV